ncbi:22K [Bat mastadenovirus]|nr:22K [Bat mastadenovirus]
MVARKGASSYKAKAASAKAAVASVEEAKGDASMELEPISSAEEDYSEEEEGSYTDEEEAYSSEELVDLEDLPEELLAKLPPEALAALKSAQQTSDAPRAASPPAAAPSEPEAPLASEPPAAPAKKSKRRWDQVSAADGKTPEPTTTTSATTGGRRAYRSWRQHKNAILACLLESGGNVAFSRRYLLFHEGVLLPKNVIRYYNSYYR